MNNREKFVKNENIFSLKIIKIYNFEENKVQELDFEQYITSVLIGEKPASYKIEALKAQAVAARSYVINKITNLHFDIYSKKHKAKI